MLAFGPWVCYRSLRGTFNRLVDPTAAVRKDRVAVGHGWYLSESRHVHPLRIALGGVIVAVECVLGHRLKLVPFRRFLCAPP